MTTADASPPRLRRSLRVALLEVVGLSLLLLLCCDYHVRVGDLPERGVLEFHPLPDAAEQAFVAQAFARGRDPMLPIGNELHPSRFSPVSPFLQSLTLRWLGDYDAEALLSHSVFAVQAALVLLYAWMAALGLSVPARLAAIWMLVRTPMLRQMGRNILQEPQILLLFALAGLAAALALRLLRRRPGQSAGLAAAAVAGAGAVAAMCIRPTNAGLVLALAGGLALDLGWRRAWFGLLAFAAGGAAVAAIDVIHIHRVSGLWALHAYGHWMPGFVGFSWGQAGERPLSPEWDDPHWVLTLQSLFGMRVDVTGAGPMSTSLMIIGLLWFLPRAIPHVSRATPPLLALFAAAQAVAFSFYPHHYPRFFVTILPPLLVAGVAGWDAALRAHASAGGRRRRATALALGALATVFIAAPHRPFPERDNLWWRQRTVQEERRQVQRHRTNAPEARPLGCPLFVDRIGLLEARLLLRLVGWPHPVAPIYAHLDLFWDGHMPQFMIQDVQPPRGHLDDPALWPGTPLETHLVDHRGTVRAEWIAQLIARHGRIALYFPPWRPAAVDKLLDWAPLNGYRLTDIGREPVWRLVLMEPVTAAEASPS